MDFTSCGPALSSILVQRRSNAKSAPPPNKRMNPALLRYNRQRLCAREKLKHVTIRPLNPQSGLSAAPLARQNTHEGVGENK